MKPLMNLPQWFLERKDSSRIFVELAKDTKNLVSLFDTYTNDPKIKFILCYYLYNDGASKLLIDGLTHISELNNYLSIYAIFKFLYDKKEDIFREVRFEIN